MFVNAHICNEFVNTLVLIDRAPPLVTITINRPQVRNCVDRPTADALVAAFEAFDRDPELRVAILTGADGHFCAGADLKAVSTGDAARMNHVGVDGSGPLGPTRMRLSKPVIAAVSGHAVAGGLELALWCDLRVADDSAVFGVYCRRWGVPLIDGGTVRLPRLIGQSRAMDMILTGRPVAADEAFAMGLANRRVPAGEALNAAKALAMSLCAFPQACLRSDRQSALDQWALSEADAIAHEFQLGYQTIQTGETVAGASRFADGSGRHGQFGGSDPETRA